MGRTAGVDQQFRPRQDVRKGGSLSRDRSRFLCRFFASAGALALVVLSFAPAKAGDWKPMPWHLADIWWDFPAETGDFHMLSVDMEIAGQEIGDLPVYFAPIGLGE